MEHLQAELITPQELPCSAPAPKITPLAQDNDKYTLTGEGLNVYIKGRPMLFTLTAPGHTGTLNYCISNSLNGQCMRGNCNIKLSCGAFLIDLAPCKLNCGHYHLVLKVKGNALHADFALLPAGAGKTSYQAFGVDYASAWHVKDEMLTSYARALKLSGVGWARERIRLKDVYNGGNYDFAHYDAAFALIKQQGIKITVCFHDLPDELLRGGISDCDLTGIFTFAKALAKHFEGIIDAWEIWNEEDVTYFSCGTPEEYAAFMKAFALGLDAAGSTALKLFGSYSRRCDHSFFYQRVQSNGILNYVDVYNFHTYVFPAPKTAPELDAEAVRQHMENARENKLPAWLTETGTIIAPSNPDNIAGEDLQLARYVALAPVQAAAAGVQLSFGFMLPYYYETVARFGYFNPQHAPLPAYTALSTVCSQLGKCKILGTVTLPCRGYAIFTGDDYVLYLYNDRPVTVSLPTVLPVAVYDAYGGEYCYAPKHGHVDINVGLMPVYVHLYHIRNNLYNDSSVNTEKPSCHELSPQAGLFTRFTFDACNMPFFPNPQNNEGEVLTTGYLINGSAHATLEICNFTAQNRQCSVELLCDDGVTVDFAKEAFVPAFSTVKQPLSLTLTAQTATCTATVSADGLTGYPTVVYLEQKNTAIDSVGAAPAKEN